MSLKVRKVVILLCWVAVWQILATCINNHIFMVGPLDTMRALLLNIMESDFWKTIIFSTIRIIGGFLLGLFGGLFLAIWSKKHSLVEEIFAPIMILIKAIPVASFVVLLLIWWGTSFLSTAISFLIVFPNIYINTLEGLKNTDIKLLEMAKVFQMPVFNQIFYIYRPSMKPFLDSSLKISLGMSWKSGVAAEVIGTPDFSIGDKIYFSKIYMDTANLFAWTIVIILLSYLCERGFLKIWSGIMNWQPKCKAVKNTLNSEQKEMAFVGVSKSFGEQKILESIDATYKKGEIYFLTQPSGQGKTTTIRLLSGLEKADKGQVIKYNSAGIVFQEDRLCEAYSAVKNVELINGDEVEAREQLLELLPEDCLDKPCNQLSGGMKRRVCVVRAMVSKSEAVLLDEPLTGLDKATRQQTLRYILDKQQNRTILMATHHIEDEKFY